MPRRDLRLVRCGGQIIGFDRLPIDKRETPEELRDELVIQLAVDERSEIRKMRRAHAAISELFFALLCKNEPARQHRVQPLD